MLNAEAKLEEFIGLIKWASYKYAQSSGHAFSYDDFVGEGQLVLAKCLQVWEKRGYRVAKNERMGRLISKNEKRVRAILGAEARLEKEFAKYFKTALMNKFNGICSHRDLFAKKRVHVSVSLDDEDFTPPPLNAYERVNFSGFEDIFYKELVEHVHTTLENEIEKKIFMLLADPPEGLCKLAIYRNRRKMKSTHITKKTRNGVNVVRPTTGLILEYLKEQGHDLTRMVYYLHLRNIKKAVKEAIMK